MKQYFKNNNSENLILFFCGWGCDEKEFSLLNSKSDILFLFDYQNLEFKFDFSKYKEIVLLAFSAGVFVSSILNFDFKIKNKIAIYGNPYLFDEHFGLSKNMIQIFKNINEENCDDFRLNYLVQTKEEFENFKKAQPQRTLESCNFELDCLKKIYDENYNNIKNIFDVVLAGENDKIFTLKTQKEFFKDKLKVIQNARHNIFFRFKSFDEIIDYAIN